MTDPTTDHADLVREANYERASYGQGSPSPMASWVYDALWRLRAVERRLERRGIARGRYARLLAAAEEHYPSAARAHREAGR